jgi:hypothetical protein
VWPAELVGRLPTIPDNKFMLVALSSALVLAAQVLTRDAELRLMSDAAPDNGAELRKFRCVTPDGARRGRTRASR